MRRAGQLAAVLTLTLCQLCCKRADSFEVVIEKTTKGDSSGLIATPGLSGRPAGRITGCSIDLYTGLNDADAAKGHEFGEIHLTAVEPAKHFWDWIVTDQISSNGRRLTGRDLRLGHRIRVTYELTPKPRALAKVEALNYTRPTKALLLSMSTVVGGELEGSLPLESVERVVITVLSWRLPSDVAILKSTERTEGTTPIGELRITYKLVESKTAWLYRPYEVHESLDLETKLMDGNASTNWDRISFTGGFSPGASSDVNDMTAAEVLTKVPPFEIRARESKKK